MFHNIKPDVENFLIGALHPLTAKRQVSQEEARTVALLTLALCATSALNIHRKGKRVAWLYGSKTDNEPDATGVDKQPNAKQEQA